MTAQSLADYGLERNPRSKPPAAMVQIRHASGMSQRKPHRKPTTLNIEKISSPLHRMFLKRLNQELEERDWSDNELARKCGLAMNLTADEGRLKYQSQIKRIARDGQNPGLEMVEVIAAGLGISPISLLTDAFMTRSARTTFLKGNNSSLEGPSPLRETAHKDKRKMHKR